MRHLSPLLYWICPCYSHLSPLETQSKWVSVNKQEVGESGRMRAFEGQDTNRERTMPPTTEEWKIKVLRRVSTIFERKFLPGALWLGSVFSNLSCLPVFLITICSWTSQGQATHLCDSNLGLLRTVPAWHATCYLLPGLSDSPSVCLLDWTSLSHPQMHAPFPSSLVWLWAYFTSLCILQ